MIIPKLVPIIYFLPELLLSFDNAQNSRIALAECTKLIHTKDAVKTKELLNEYIVSTNKISGHRFEFGGICCAFLDFR